MGRKFGHSFSWNRASGLSAMKGKVSRSIGIPLSQSGRERKLGRMIMGGGLFSGGKGGSIRAVKETKSGGCARCLGVLAIMGMGLIALVGYLMINGSPTVPADHSSSTATNANAPSVNVGNSSGKAPIAVAPTAVNRVQAVPVDQIRAQLAQAKKRAGDAEAAYQQEASQAVGVIMAEPVFKTAMAQEQSLELRVQQLRDEKSPDLASASMEQIQAKRKIEEMAAQANQSPNVVAAKQKRDAAKAEVARLQKLLDDAVASTRSASNVTAASPHLSPSNAIRPNSAQPGVASPGTNGSTTGGGSKDVHVSGYINKNGKVVAPYDRNAPSEGSSKKK